MSRARCAPCSANVRWKRHARAMPSPPRASASATVYTSRSRGCTSRGCAVCTYRDMSGADADTFGTLVCACVGSKFALASGGVPIASRIFETLSRAMRRSERSETARCVPRRQRRVPCDEVRLTAMFSPVSSSQYASASMIKCGGMHRARMNAARGAGSCANARRYTTRLSFFRSSQPQPATAARSARSSPASCGGNGARTPACASRPSKRSAFERSARRRRSCCTTSGANANPAAESSKNCA
jgi:hypothetical protein